ncbi:MAG: aminotransferase class V-fold PLP-dependent enzyme [Myxococcota bacterium]
MSDRKLLMIPGPIEVSPEVRAAHDGPPPGHLAPPVVEAFGLSLERMRAVWQAPASAQPFLIAGSGTLAMDMAAANLVQSGDRVLVLGTGYFSDRMAEILQRYGADVALESAPVGEAVSLNQVEAALEREKPKVVCVTHVDTSTGVRMDAQAVAAKARAAGALTVVDGVCATAAEPLSMESGDVDIYLTGSQKAVGLPAGLALFVASERAMAAREALALPPPYYLDFHQWRPIMRAYEAREKAYFATPATNLVMAAAIGLEQILDDRFGGKTGMAARTARHAHVACAMEGAWRTYGLEHLCRAPADRGVTLSALEYPTGAGPALVPEIGKHGVVVAGGLHPERKADYFRVGHMGWATTQVGMLEKTVAAVGLGLRALGVKADVEAAVAAFRSTYDSEA